MGLSDCSHCEGTGYEPNGATDPRDPGWAEECHTCEGTGDRYMRPYRRPVEMLSGRGRCHP